MLNLCPDFFPINLNGQANELSTLVQTRGTEVSAVWWVAFFAPWSTESIAFKKTFKKFAKRLGSDKDDEVPDEERCVAIQAHRHHRPSHQRSNPDCHALTHLLVPSLAHSSPHSLNHPFVPDSSPPLIRPPPHQAKFVASLARGGESESANPAIRSGAVDCVLYEHLCLQLEVGGANGSYPVLKLYVQGTSAVDYQVGGGVRRGLKCA